MLGLRLCRAVLFAVFLLGIFAAWREIFRLRIPSNTQGMRCNICLLMCFSLGIFSSATGISAAQEGGSTVALIGARLIDGSGEAPLENAALVIQGETLIAVGPAASVKFPGGTAVIDCHGQTIIPGLISDHSHVGLVDGVSVKPENYNRSLTR